MSLIIHAGFHKTGSTAVQEFLFANREYLCSNGLSYPQPLCKYASHGELAWSYLRDLATWRDRDYEQKDVWAYYGPIIEENRQSGLSTLLSNEDISLIELSDDWFDAFVSEARVFNPLILFYVRHPIDVIGSHYGHMIIEGATRRSFKDWLCVEFHHDTVDYRRRLLRWENAFGAESIIVREYSKEGAIEDFLRLFSINVPEGFVGSRVNPGIHAWFTDTYRLLPFGPAGDDARNVLRAASSLAPRIDIAEFHLGKGDADVLRAQMDELYFRFLQTAKRLYRSSLL